MSEQQSEATQAEAGAQSQADTQSTDDSATQAEASQESISLDEAKKLRSEASSLRKRLKDAESKVQAAEEAGKSEEEKRTSAMKAAEERAQTAEQRLREATGRTAIYDAVKPGGSSYSEDPEAVYALALNKIEFDDDGEPTNVDEIVAALKKSNPKQFKHSSGRGDGGAGGDNQREIKPGLDRLAHAYETTSKTAKR